MNSRARQTVAILRSVWLVALCAPGAIASIFAVFSYLVRYSHLDSLEREIPDNVYDRVTSRFGIERVLLFGGFGLFVVAGTLAVVAGITASRRRR